MKTNREKVFKALDRGIITRSEAERRLAYIENDERKARAEARRKAHEADCTAPMWLTIISVFIGLVCLSFLSPLAYVWLFGLLACVGVLGVTGAILASMDGLSGCIFGPQLVRGAFELIGAILQGLVYLSR
jgi:hypothetical protein